MGDLTLGEKQRIFTRLLPRLLSFAHDNGYEVTLGDAYRDPRLHGKSGEKAGYGHRNSCHKKRLAIDLNLFKGGVYQTTTDSHKLLGEYWESLHTDTRWGGRFNDGNHYSIEHNGSQ